MNTYWPVYKSLESEVLNLTNYILFTDEQLKVYSLSIGNLIIRCAIEIESISKDLYALLGGAPKVLDNSTHHDKNPYFDTDCIKLLVDKWHIDKKKVQITSPNIYLTAAKSILTPLHKAHKRGTSGSKWKQAYQAIKHGRSQVMESASIENLLNALGALYILNLYYREESFWSGTPIKGRCAFSSNSDIFTPFICNATHIHMSPEMGDNHMDEIADPSLDESIYIEKFVDKTCSAIHTALCSDNLRAFFKIKASKEYAEHLHLYPEDAALDMSEIAAKLDINFYLLCKQESKFGEELSRLKMKEIVLNKHTQIYPTLTFEQFKGTDAVQKIFQEVEVLKGRNSIVLPKRKR